MVVQPAQRAIPELLAMQVITALVVQVVQEVTRETPETLAL